MLQQNQDKIEALEQNKFFSTKFNNKIGLAFVEYLDKGSYGNLRNSEPIDLNKNTLSKILLLIKVLDSFLEKDFSKHTIEDMDRFVQEYRKGNITRDKVIIAKREGKISIDIKKTKTPRAKHEVARIISEYKRIMKVFSQYMLKYEPNNYEPRLYEWIRDYFPPKEKFKYEDYPYYTISELLALADGLAKPEYTARMVLSLNLMGRKCEVSHLRVNAVDFRNDGSVWVELPNIKKHSSEKVPVELYSYAKERLKKYMKLNHLEADDLLFPSKETAFAKDLKKKSVHAFGKKKSLSPKHLRKLGVCIAAELELPRHKVEDVGGWKRNSPILEHYFKRMGVAANHLAEQKLAKTEYKDIYVEFDRLKNENQKALEQLQLFADLLKQKVNISVDNESDVKLAKGAYTSLKKK